MEPLDTPANSTTNRFSSLPFMIVGAWLLCAAFAFWWFEYRYWGAYPDQLIQFDSKAVTKLYSILNKGHANQRMVVHFIDESCPCDAYRVAHVSKLAPILAHSVEISLTPQDVNQLDIPIPATPAVAIWDEAGELAYFGPYSSGMTCGTGLDFIALVYTKLTAGNNPNWINSQGYGCFCPRQEG